MSHQDIYKQVSERLQIPQAVVKEAYESYWRFIKETIKGLPLKEDLTDEEFSRLRTNFNIPSIGKLSCTLDRYKGVQKRYEYIRRLREKNKNTEHHDSKNQECKAHV